MPSPPLADHRRCRAIQASDEVWQSIQRLQAARLSHAEILIAVLYEAVWMIDALDAARPPDVSDSERREIQDVIEEVSRVSATALVRIPAPILAHRLDRH